MAELHIPDHGTLPGLGDDDHTQYLLLAGRAGGQSAFGGTTAAAEELNLTGSSNADLGRVRVNSPFEIDEVSAGDQTAFRYRPTFTTGGAFIGGVIAGTADITYDATTFIWSLLSEGSTYRAAVGPGFAAFTLFNAIPTIQNSGNFDLVQALILNVGSVHARITSGTSTTIQTIGVAFSPQTRASVSGAVMTRSTGMIGLQISPTFSTVVGSTVNLGTVIGMRCVEPATALFQTGTGTENLTAYYGIDFENITFATSGDKVVVRSAMTDAGDRFFLQNNGGARSDFGGGNLLDCGIVQILSDTATLSLGAAGGDVQIGWNGSVLDFDPIVGDDMRFAFATDIHTIDSASTSEDSAINFDYPKGAFGEAGAPGNNKYRFVANAETVTIAGEFSQFVNRYRVIR